MDGGGQRMEKAFFSKFNYSYLGCNELIETIFNPKDGGLEESLTRFEAQLLFL